jgi:hypothetical protein
MELSGPSLADWGRKGNRYRAVLELLAKAGPDNITGPYLAERWTASAIMANAMLINRRRR